MDSVCKISSTNERKKNKSGVRIVSEIQNDSTYLHKTLWVWEESHEEVCLMVFLFLLVLSGTIILCLETDSSGLGSVSLDER